MSIGPGPIREVGAGLKQAWTDAKTSFAPVVKEMKGLPKKALEASKKILNDVAVDVATSYSAFLELDKTDKLDVLKTSLLWGGTALSSLIAVPLSIHSGAPPIVVDALGIATGLLGTGATSQTLLLKERLNEFKKVELEKIKS